MLGEDVVLGLDLARARGVAVRGLGESFRGPRSLPTTMTHSRVIYLLGGIAARPPSFGSSSSARLLARRRVLLELLFWCEGGLLDIARVAPVQQKTRLPLLSSRGHFDPAFLCCLLFCVGFALCTGEL
jgi:hypothetical protein